MADHLRKQIRAAVVASGVLGNLTTTSTRVANSPVYDLTDLPALRISTPAEAMEIESLGASRIRRHTLTLAVEACVKANSSYVDTVDLICKEVQIALDASNTLGGLCKWIEPKSFEQQLEGEGDKAIAVGRMEFDVVYFTAQGAPDVAL